MVDAHHASLARGDLVAVYPGCAGVAERLDGDWGETDGELDMRIGRWEVEPLGGGIGCFTMILFSVVASIVLTVLLNLLIR
jgi:hypothetical protein